MRSLVSRLSGVSRRNSTASSKAQADEGNSPFGVPLEELLLRSPCTHPLVPGVVSLILEHLREEKAVLSHGLFRITGDRTASAAMRKELRETGTLREPNYEPHALAGVFKAWVNDIPGKLISGDQFATFQAAMDSVASMRRAVASIEPHKRALLEYIIMYLHLVADYKSANLMSIENLSVVFAPNVIQCPSEPSPGSPGNVKNYLEESMLAAKMFAQLINKSEWIFPTTVEEAQSQSVTVPNVERLSQLSINDVAAPSLGLIAPLPDHESLSTILALPTEVIDGRRASPKRAAWKRWTKKLESFFQRSKSFMKRKGQMRRFDRRSSEDTARFVPV
ncbi:hypothetical protein HKX48_004127 [Thoreauomyces humboldtii]|nr:hypothetical protein HKX48_004127 [Thoreauomyces humboldtii]